MPGRTFYGNLRHPDSGREYFSGDAAYRYAAIDCTANGLKKGIKKVLGIAPENVMRLADRKGEVVAAFIPRESLVSSKGENYRWMLDIGDAPETHYSNGLNPGIEEKATNRKPFDAKEERQVCAHLDECRKARRYVEREKGLRIRYVRDFGSEAGRFVGWDVIPAKEAKKFISQYGWLLDEEEKLESYLLLTNEGLLANEAKDYVHLTQVMINDNERKKRVGNFDDFKQEGFKALLIASGKYDSARGVRLTSYAEKRIFTYINKYAKFLKSLPADEPIDGDGRNEPEAPRIWSPDAGLAKLDVRKLLPLLSERELLVVQKHYGLGDRKAMTFEDIGKEMNTTKQMVKKIEKTAVMKMRGMALQEQANI